VTAEDACPTGFATYMNSDNGRFAAASYCCCTRAVNATVLGEPSGSSRGRQGAAGAIVHGGTSQDTHNANEVQTAKERQESESQRQRLRLSGTQRARVVSTALEIWRWLSVSLHERLAIVTLDMIGPATFSAV
jgi:hypothetical protein